LSETNSHNSLPLDMSLATILLLLSGGAIVVSLSHAEVLIVLVGQVVFLAFISISIVALIVTIVAALLKNEFRAGEVKAGDFLEKSKLLQNRGKDDEKVTKAIEIYKKRAKIKSASAKQILGLSEIILKVALGIIVIAFLLLVIAFWSVPLQNLSLAGPDTAQPDKSKEAKKGANEIDKQGESSDSGSSEDVEEREVEEE